jgi:hypothetical protein
MGFLSVGQPEKRLLGIACFHFVAVFGFQAAFGWV